MHPLYTAPYFRRYLQLSIQVFEWQYISERGYKYHPRWEDLFILFIEAGVEKILICEGRMLGYLRQEYICFPITESSISEEKIRSSYPFVVEEIDLR